MQGKLMPNLKPAGYRSEVALFFKRSLMDDPNAPVVAIGKDFGEGVSYQSVDSQEAFDREFPLAFEEAIRNLKDVATTTDVQEYEGTKIAFISGHEYAAEKILDSDFMKSIATQIGCINAMVGLPFKGMMIVTDADSSLRFKFPNVIKQYFENPQSPAISPNVFLVQDGEIMGMGSESKNDENTNGALVINEDNGNNYTIRATASTAEEIRDVVNGTYNQLLLSIMSKKEFGGSIKYHLSGSQPLSMEASQKCLSIVKQIDENEMAQTLLEATTGKKATVSFYYNGELVTDVPIASKPSASTIIVPDYPRFSEQDLNDEFFAIVKIPGAATNEEALTKMTALIKEYEKRGLKTPDPSNPPRTKKWWEFWK